MHRIAAEGDKMVTEEFIWPGAAAIVAISVNDNSADFCVSFRLLFCFVAIVFACEDQMLFPQRLLQHHSIQYFSFITKLIFSRFVLVI